jgi:hypothetical protein
MRVSRGHRRLGLSEAIGAVLTIALTLIAGAAVFSYVNSQALVSEQQLGASSGATNNYLAEQYSVINANYTASSVSLWLYNSGQVNLQPVEVQVYNTAKTFFVQYSATQVINENNPTGCTVAASTSNENPILYNAAPGANNPSGVVSIGQGTVGKITLTLPSCVGYSFTSGTAYYMTVVGHYGNTVTYYQTM